MAKMDVYLNFAGNTEEAFKFYKSVFRGDFSSFTRFKDKPKQSRKISKQEENKILNISLPIGKENVLSASDTLGSRGQKLIQGNNFYISISPDNKREADRIFRALSEEGRIILPISNQPWNAYYGSFTDKFGVRWMVSYAYPKNKAKARPARVTKAKAAPVLKRKNKAAPVKKSKAKVRPPAKRKQKPVLKIKPKAKAATKSKTKTTLIPKSKAKDVPITKGKLKREPVRITTLHKNRPKRALTGAVSGRSR